MIDKVTNMFKMHMFIYKILPNNFQPSKFNIFLNK